MTASDPAANERRAREHFDRLFNRGEVDHDVLAEDFRIHANSHDPRTPERQLEAIEFYRDAFPDLAVSVEDAFATRSRVALRYTVTGTHEGELQGIPPTHTAVEIRGIGVYRVEDGLLAGSWHVADNAGLHDQVLAAAEAED